MKHYKNRIRLLKLVQIGLIAVLVLAFFGYAWYQFKPEIVKYNLDDECGPIANTISHSIPEEDQCSNLCMATCQSHDYKYKNHKFTKNTLSCNDCECYCVT